MDMICPQCGEPWDTDSVYHENDRPELSPTQAYRLFRSKGCGAIFTGVSCKADRNADVRLELADLLGDDGDGYASLCEDLRLDRIDETLNG